MLVNIHTHYKRADSIEIVNCSEILDFPSYYSLGIHPWDSGAKGLKISEIERNSEDKFMIAIGEIGLDKIKGPLLEIQKMCFIDQVLIAEKINRPVIIHCVKAWNEIAAIKKQLQPKQTWIFHGFSKAAILDSVLQEGLMISIGAGILNNATLQEALLRIPNDQLFLETDDSEITILEVYKKVSTLKKLSLSELEQIIENNFKRIFRI
jgi:TatD DNase family protein